MRTQELLRGQPHRHAGRVCAVPCRRAGRIPSGVVWKGRASTPKPTPVKCTAVTTPLRWTRGPTSNGGSRNHTSSRSCITRPRPLGGIGRANAPPGRGPRKSRARRRCLVYASRTPALGSARSDLQDRPFVADGHSSRARRRGSSPLWLPPGRPDSSDPSLTYAPFPTWSGSWARLATMSERTRHGSGEGCLW
jgi:hypothetical protein